MASPQTQNKDETLAPAEDGQEAQKLSDSTNATNSQNESAPKTLELATELFNKGSKAIEEEDYVEAVDCLSRALEIRAEKYGELAPECATTYYKYGCALLYKAQEEADPLGDVPKNPLTNAETEKPPKSLSTGEDLVASVSDASAAKELSNKNGSDEKEQDDDSEDDAMEADDDELAEADGEESDLEFAWKMLDIARVIIEKNPEERMEIVNVYSALGEVSMEREDFETSFNDYLKALSICERLEEPDSRRVIELNLRVCLVLEVWGKVEESIPYCEKAISLCKSHINRLNEHANQTALPGDTMNGNKAGNDAAPCTDEKDKEALKGILNDLERKLEDLRQSLSNPKPELAEIMKVIADKFASKNTVPGCSSASLNSSQKGAENVSSSFDSPTLSAADNGNSSGSTVTHLGVVGRGVKRASLASIFPEPSKKIPLASSDNDGSSVTQSADSTVQDAGTPK